MDIKIMLTFETYSFVNKEFLVQMVKFVLCVQSGWLFSRKNMFSNTHLATFRNHLVDAFERDFTNDWNSVCWVIVITLEPYVLDILYIWKKHV